MEISRRSCSYDLANLLLGILESDLPTFFSTLARWGGQVEISERARKRQRIKAVVYGTDTVRNKRVEQIRREIETGTYLVHGQTVADAVLRHALKDTLLYQVEETSLEPIQMMKSSTHSSRSRRRICAPTGTMHEWNRVWSLGRRK
jgi:anti-sigma28 factor (negative regulator of flagellin synthesis)